MKKKIRFVLSDYQLDVAIAWLDCNDAGDEEEIACQAVAAMLARIKLRRTIDRAARAAGVPVSYARRKLANMDRRA